MEHAILELIDLALDRLDDRHVVVDDEVEDGIEDVVLAAGEDSGTGLERFRGRWRMRWRRRDVLKRRSPFPRKM